MSTAAKYPLYEGAYSSPLDIPEENRQLIEFYNVCKDILEDSKVKNFVDHETLDVFGRCMELINIDAPCHYHMCDLMDVYMEIEACMKEQHNCVLIGQYDGFTRKTYEFRDAGILKHWDVTPYYLPDDIYNLVQNEYKK